MHTESRTTHSKSWSISCVVEFYDDVFLRRNMLFFVFVADSTWGGGSRKGNKWEKPVESANAPKMWNRGACRL